MHAYSYLKSVLKQERLSVPELQRRMQAKGMHVNLKSLYRLTDDRQPIDRLDMRVAGAICTVISVSLSDWIVFQEEPSGLKMLSPDKQADLDSLMAKNNQGTLSASERDTFGQLVREVEEVTLANARVLAQQKLLPLKPEDALTRAGSGRAS